MKHNRKVSHKVDSSLVVTLANVANLNIVHNDRDMGRAIEAIGRLIKWHNEATITASAIVGCAEMIKKCGYRVTVTRLLNVFFAYLLMEREKVTQ